MSRPDALDLIRSATAAGIDLFDTAPAYGSAESLLGEAHLPTAVKFVTKTVSPKKEVLTVKALSGIRSAFTSSLRRLGRDQIYGLMVHAPSEGPIPAAEAIFALLAEFRDQGLVSKIGVSTYTPAQVEYCLRFASLDLYQVPVSYLDQRLIRSGLLADVVRHGAEIHVRSCFLQGLLLMPPYQLPDYFDPWRTELTRIWQRLHAAATEPAVAAMSYLRRFTSAQYLIFGAHSREQLQRLTTQWLMDAPPLPFDEFFIDDEALINPATWPRSLGGGDTK